MLLGDAVWTASGPGGRVSAGLMLLSVLPSYTMRRIIMFVSSLFFFILQSGSGGNGKYLTLQKALYHPSVGSH